MVDEYPFGLRVVLGFLICWTTVILLLTILLDGSGSCEEVLSAAKPFETALILSLVGVFIHIFRSGIIKKAKRGKAVVGRWDFVTMSLAINIFLLSWLVHLSPVEHLSPLMCAISELKLIRSPSSNYAHQVVTRAH